MTNRFRKLLNQGKTIVFDGGMGTALFNRRVFIRQMTGEERSLGIAKAHEQDNERAEGLNIAIEIMEKVIPRIQGIQVVAPFGRIKSAIAVLEAATARL